MKGRANDQTETIKPAQQPTAAMMPTARNPRHAGSRWAKPRAKKAKMKPQSGTAQAVTGSAKTKHIAPPT